MLSPSQRDIVESPLNRKLFVSGPAGCGKTTAAVERMRFLLEQGVPGETILLLTPQRSLQEPYLDLLYSPERGAGGEVTPATVGGLARRLCELFWPLAAEAAGFAHPEQPPRFLTLETAQYYMAHLVRPLLDEGFFESVTIDSNRLYSQIIDNLNKAAVIGFPHTEIGARLDAAYFGDPAQRRVYADAQECASRFRRYCLEHNLLDFSLQFEIFTNLLWREEIVRDYLMRTYRHLIYDNVEEDVPRAHDLLREWLPLFDSALLIYDEEAGFRYFLGADVETAWALRELCDEHVRLQESFVMRKEVAALSGRLTEAIVPGWKAQADEQHRDGEDGGAGEALAILQSRFYPQLLDAVAGEVHQLVQGGVPPAEIVVLAPYMPDALRFSVLHRLETLKIPWRSHRPSRALRDEPASHALITLAALAHPHWGIRPPRFDVAYAFMQSIDGLDLIRAQLLAEIVYRPRELRLSAFDQINSEMQDRITFGVGNRYSLLRAWLEDYRASNPLPLDHFWRRLFGEVLSQPGFGFQRSFDAVRVAASLVESMKKFRQALEPAWSGETDDAGSSLNLGREYIQMLNDGVIAASYWEGWQSEQKDAVLVAPAHTFLMMNRPVSYQFWLDAGSSGWYERLSQPLTHPFVLSRWWEPGRQWSDAEDVHYSRQALARLVSGLLHRCRARIYLCISELGESGFEQRGELLRAFQKVL